MNAVSSLLNGTAGALPPGAGPDQAATGDGLPGDIAGALFVGVTPDFQQLLADASDAASETTGAALGDDGVAGTDRAGERSTLLTLLAGKVSSTADATVAGGNGHPVAADGTAAAPKPARQRRESQPASDDPVAVQILTALAPAPMMPVAVTTAIAGSEDAASVATDVPPVRDGDLRASGERAARIEEATLQQLAMRTANTTQDGSSSRRESGGERRGLPMAGLNAFTANASDATATAAAATHAMARSFTQAPTVERLISVPVYSPQWPQALNAEVRWLADHGVQAATLRLSPEHLGPVEVRVDVRDSQVNVSFGASHADTRAALEQALPKLREMFAGAGLSLGQASVQQEMRRESQNQQPAVRGMGREEDVAAAAARVVALGLVDEYA